jgi:DNA-binding LacI/PurR family transcriptional regulator
MVDVAKLAGVSQTTVSFILSGRSAGDDRISGDTRARVMEAIAQLNYVPNQAARSLRKQRTERIALFIDRLGAPYFESLAQSLQTAAEQRGYSLILLVGKSEAQQRRVLQTLQQGLVDGAFFTSLRNVHNADLSDLTRAGVAVVAYSNILAAEGVDCVHYPGLEGAQNAVDHLVRKGHREIAFVGFEHSVDDQDMRLQGYLEAMHRHGLKPDTTLVLFEDWLSRERIYETALAILKRPDQPSGIISASDFGAICTIAAAQDLGLRVPQDVAVMGFGNIPESRFVRPSLTTVGPDPLDFTPAVDMLFSRLSGNAPAQSRTWRMEWKLIERNST